MEHARETRFGVPKITSFGTPRTDAIELFGPPDLVKNTNDAVEWLYFYDRFGTKDWFVIAAFDKDEPYAEFYYNGTSTLDKAVWIPYKEDDGGATKINATRQDGEVH